MFQLNFLISYFQENDDVDIFVQHKLTRVLIASDEIIIIVEGVLLCKLESNQLAEAVVSFLSTYYLLDVSYPANWEIPLTMLQFIILGDFQAPTHIVTSVNENWKQFQNLVFQYHSLCLWRDA